jgi:hypothetical protein
MVVLPLLTILPDRYSVATGLGGDVTGAYFTHHLALIHGLLPYRDFTFEYPPGALLLHVFPWVAGHSRNAFFVLWIVQMLAIDVSIRIAIERIGRRTGAAEAVWASWAWTVAGPLLGGLTLVRNDLLACGLVAWSAVFLIERRPRLAGALVGIAILAKLWPVVLLVALAMTRLPVRRRLVASAAAAAVPVAAALTAWGMFGPMVSSLLSYHGRRGLQVESLAAWPILVATRLHGHRPATESTFGSTNLVGHPAVVAGTTYVSVAVVAAILGTVWWRHRRTGLTVAHALSCAAACLGASMAADKVFSPQYAVWLLVVVALAGACGGADRRTIVLAGACVALTGLVYPNFYADVVLAHTGALVVIGLRDLVLLATVAAAWATVMRRGGTVPAPRTQKHVAQRPAMAAVRSSAP